PISSRPNSSHQKAVESPAGPAPIMITSCIVFTRLPPAMKTSAKHLRLHPAVNATPLTFRPCQETSLPTSSHDYQFASVLLNQFPCCSAIATRMTDRVAQSEDAQQSRPMSSTDNRSGKTIQTLSESRSKTTACGRT